MFIVMMLNYKISHCERPIIRAYMDLDFSKVFDVRSSLVREIIMGVFEKS